MIEFGIALIFSGLAYVVGAAFASGSGDPSVDYSKLLDAGAIVAAVGFMACVAPVWFERLRSEMPPVPAPSAPDRGSHVKKFAAVLRSSTVSRFLTRLFGLVAAVYIAGLPTYYALFTVGDTGSVASAVQRAAIPLFVAWVLVALMAGYLTLLKDSELMRILRPARRRLRSARQNETVTNLLAQLLLHDKRSATLRAFHPTVFVSDDRDHPSELTPYGEDSPAEWERWRVGYGAVGAAFDENQKDKVLVFKGEDLAKQNRTLTEAQLVQYGSLKLVAAMVLRGPDERPIGALGASPTTPSVLARLGSTQWFSLPPKSGSSSTSSDETTDVGDTI